MSFAIVVLAAGESKRFGSPKQLALLDGRPLILHVCDRCRQANPAKLVVVLGADADQIVPLLSEGIDIVHNAHWQVGMSSSIRSGIEAIEDNVDAVIIVLADQPRISADHLSQLVQSLKRSEVAATKYPDGSLGVPAAFSKARFNSLKSLSGQAGAKPLFTGDVVEVPYRMVEDIDTVEDLKKLGS